MSKAFFSSRKSLLQGKRKSKQRKPVSDTVTFFFFTEQLLFSAIPLSLIMTVFLESVFLQLCLLKFIVTICRQLE